MQGRLLAVDHECVSRIVTALVANDVVYFFGKKIDDLPFALVAPLATEND